MRKRSDAKADEHVQGRTARDHRDRGLHLPRLHQVRQSVREPYTVHAVFTNANGLKPDSLVRIAGVNVGKVQSVGPVPDCKIGGTPQKTVASGSQQCTAADVTMTIDNSGLPIHKNATFAIRPRIFLEGNFFVDVSPGTPEAPVAPDDYTFPVQQGTEPVQFDQVLTSLQSNTRQNLQTLLQQFGTALKKGGPSFNASIKYWLPAYEYSAIVAHDALGLAAARPLELRSTTRGRSRARSTPTRRTSRT